jgi:hypothetical protein
MEDGAATHTVNDGYDPNKSKLRADTVAAFINAPITEDLLDIPGLGPKGVNALVRHEVTTTFQLIGIFFSLKAVNIDVRQHCDLFWFWLKNNGIRTHRSAIVMCIAEKVNTMCPGIYDASVFAE